MFENGKPCIDKDNKLKSIIEILIIKIIRILFKKGNHCSHSA